MRGEGGFAASILQDPTTGPATGADEEHAVAKEQRSTAAKVRAPIAVSETCIIRAEKTPIKMRAPRSASSRWTPPHDIPVLATTWGLPQLQALLDKWYLCLPPARATCRRTL
jgi:hypothetical protein